jgi:hypothetical protein
MADVVNICSELLCYIQNNTSNICRNVITTNVVGFYTTEEISEAKTILFRCAEKLKQDGHVSDIPRLVNRRSGDGKRKADMDDIMDLLERLDVAKASLPSFYAVNLKRLPPLSFADSDVCSLAAVILELRCKMDDMQKNVTDLTSQVKLLNTAQQNSVTQLATVQKVSTVTTTMPTTLDPALSTAAPQSGSSPAAGGLSHATGNSARSWSGVLQTIPVCQNIDSDGFTTVGGRKPKPSPAKICGKKPLQNDSKIKTMPRRVTVFVGRLSKDTTGEALTDYLQSCGVDNPSCKKLAAKDGRHFHTAAFMVSLDSKYRNVVYDEATWPEGCEVRDWIYQDKKIVGNT